jgi:Alw26I/Eco31I/Esp3I family type II restriction endonuclease
MEDVFSEGNVDDYVTKNSIPPGLEPKVERGTDAKEEDNSSRKRYESFIANHPNYDFLPNEQKKSWVRVSKKGQNPRKPFWDTKQKQLIDSGKIPKESKPANVARFIHPTKKHICAKCGIECSIYYEYPTANTWKWLKNTFDYNKDDHTNYLTIFEIYVKITVPTKKTTFEKYFGMSMTDLETQCKSDQYSGTKLSPGVMSNAPDRLDGFHCYNSLCGCRHNHDKGRSYENMKSYTRDRRAYELLSDGRCLMANVLMGKLNTVIANCFICGKPNAMTADHIGPISLGFIHDPVNFQGCCNRCNTTKNNRMTEKDIAKLKWLEENGACLVSWWAKAVWDNNKYKSVTILNDILKKNRKKFLGIILWIKSNKPDVLERFITEIYMNHEKSYNISNVEVTSLGHIEFHCSELVTRKKTKDNQKKRTKQILLEIGYDANQNINIGLSEKEASYLSDITLDNFKNKICKVLLGL